MPEKRNLPVTRAVKHGLYSWVNSKKIPSGRAFQAVRRELGVMREELVLAHGGEKIAPDSAILVDSVIEALGVQKLLGLFIRKYGVVDAKAAKRGSLELSPSSPRIGSPIRTRSGRGSWLTAMIKKTPLRR